MSETSVPAPSNEAPAVPQKPNLYRRFRIWLATHPRIARALGLTAFAAGVATVVVAVQARTSDEESPEEPGVLQEVEYKAKTTETTKKSASA